MKMRFRTLVLCALAGAVGCTNNTTSTPADMTALSPGGFISGAVDTHCVIDGGMTMNPTSQASCKYKPDGGGDAAPDYGDTMYNSEGNDDDCKYHVKVTSIPVYQSTDTTFTVVATRTVDGMPLTGAGTMAEVFLGDTHSGITANMTTTESPPGTYKVGPVQFDKSGKWTIRFHFYEDCYDYADDSPHGHAAFYVNIP